MSIRSLAAAEVGLIILMAQGRRLARALCYHRRGSWAGELDRRLEKSLDTQATS